MLGRLFPMNSLTVKPGMLSSASHQPIHSKKIFSIYRDRACSTTAEALLPLVFLFIGQLMPRDSQAF